MDRATAWAAFKAAGWDTKYAYPQEFVDSVASKHLAKVTQEKIENEKAHRKQKRKKVSTEQAREIKNSKGQGTQQQRAERYGVSKSAVANIDQGIRWKWLGRTEAEDIKEEDTKKEKKRRIKIEYKVAIPNSASYEAYRAQLYDH